MLVAVAIPIVGALGLVNAEVDVSDTTEAPPELVAITVNVYDVFGVNPDTTIGVVEPVPVNPPGLLVTV